MKAYKKSFYLRMLLFLSIFGTISFFLLYKKNNLEWKKRLPLFAETFLNEWKKKVLLKDDEFWNNFHSKTMNGKNRLPKTRFQNVISKLANELLPEALRQAKNETYNILVWEPPFGNKFIGSPNSEECGSCKTIWKKSEAASPLTKAIIFHFNELDINNMPKQRHNDQVYIWWTMESPPTLKELRRLKLTEYDNVFNATMSHRRDSDFYSPYGEAKNILQAVQSSGSGNPIQDIDDLVARKKHLAIWLVSNCYQVGGAGIRRELINGLIDAGLDIDCRGKCFPEKDPVKGLGLIKDYKFYFSFENSWHCTDYITEKFFANGLSIGAVPIVWGGLKSDYLAVAPPNSFIHVEDFESASDLAQYINYLDKNDTAYKEYFRWRTMDTKDMPMNGGTFGFCQICRALHGINVDNAFNSNFSKLSRVPFLGYPSSPRIIPSLKQWYYDSEPKHCLRENS